MDSTPVNWETLDALVIEFAKSENLIEEHGDPPSPPASLSSPSSSSYHSRLLIRQIRHSLQVGDIDAALELIRLHAPFILDDHRILFRLHKQKFIELLRKGTDKDRDSAIDCLRNALAPSALDAYPEAYEEFKHVLLAFIYDKDDQSSPVANEWSERRRFEIAGLMSSVLRAHSHAYDPVFSMTLRYLISIHKGFCMREGISSPISDLNERLLLGERDLPATPQESLHGAPPFDEVDIQALAHAVELTRQGAIDSLRFAKGNLFQAFQNELSRMQLDVSLLDELIREYCVYRGIVDSGFGSPYEMEAPSRLLKVEQPENGDCSSRNSSIVIDYIAAKHSEDETSVSDSHVNDEKNIDASISPATDVEVRYPCEPTDHHDVSSTSETSQFEHMKIAHRNRSYRTGERNRRKRWKGRHDQVDITFNTNLCGNKRQELVPATQEACRSLSKEQQDSMKYEIVLGMKELASKGMAAEVVDEVNVIDPNFFVQNPTLLFQLKQVEFLKVVRSGDHSGALRVACSHLGPLAAKDPALLKPLKETLLALLRPSEETHGTGLPLHALASSLQVALGRRLGIEEPQLMKIMRATIHTHNEWFKLHKCKDHFEGLLKIDSLKDVNTPMITNTTSKSNADSSVYGSSQVTVSSSNRMAEDSSPTPESSGDVMCDENAILKVMEFLALPRADAIHLLVQYNGNAETVIQQMFV